jgi:hypothetical protein
LSIIIDVETNELATYRVNNIQFHVILLLTLTPPLVQITILVNMISGPSGSEEQKITSWHALAQGPRSPERIFQDTISSANMKQAAYSKGAYKSQP